jgi:protein-S-isoprenylcysteine O-methyltransferase Ste14
MTDRRTGWVFVAVQAVLLIALVASSALGREDWPTPPVVRAVSALCTLGGLVVMVVAALQLGRALTPTPVPNEHGALRTSGLYGMVRHPIYSGLLLVVIGLTLRSASWITAAIAVATIAFFHKKAAWEERRLASRYPDYPTYAARTGRFVPRAQR